MPRPRRIKFASILAVFVLVAVAASPWRVRAYWAWRSSNPVRRGVRLAAELGCFSCHGHRGGAGISDPGLDAGVPAWSGGVWMMFVDDDDDVRDIILNGSVPDQDAGKRPPIEMPAYRDRLSGSDLEDLVAAFKLLARMNFPPADSAARRGHDLAREWDCFSCHGPGGSGGLPNPGSFAGFVPGWYGADFENLVRDREEFNEWVREGTLERLEKHPIARFFLRRQRVLMPAYGRLNRGQLDDLWAYVEWLEATEGGAEGGGAPWQP